MNVFNMGGSGLWVDAGCLLLCIGLIVWETVGRLRGRGLSKEDPAPEIKRLNEKISSMTAQQELSEKKLSQAKTAGMNTDRHDAEIVDHKKKAGELIDELNKIKARSSGASVQLSAKDSEIKLLKEQLAVLPAAKAEIAAKNAEIIGLNAKLSDTRSNLEAFEKKLTEVITGAKKTESDLLQRETEIENHKKKAGGLTSEIIKHKTAAENAAGQLSLKESEIKLLKEQLAEIPAAKEEVAAKNTEIIGLNTRLSDMQNKLEAFEKKLAEAAALAHKAESDLRQRETEMEEHKKSAGELIDELNKLKAGVVNASRQLSSKDLEIKSFKEQLAELPAAKEEAAAKNAEIVRLNARLADMQSQHEIDERRLVRLREAEDAYLDSESELLSAKKYAERARSELEMIKTQVAEATKQLAEREFEIKLLKGQMAGSAIGIEALEEKDVEIKLLNARLADMQNRQEILENSLSKYKKIGSDIG